MSTWLEHEVLALCIAASMVAACSGGQRFGAAESTTSEQTPVQSAEPGADQPGVDQPGAAEPGVDQPGVDQPGAAELGAAEPGVSAPTALPDGGRVDALPDAANEPGGCVNPPLEPTSSGASSSASDATSVLPLDSGASQQTVDLGSASPPTTPASSTSNASTSNASTSGSEQGVDPSDPCAAKPGNIVGLGQRTLDVAGKQRSFAYYVPQPLAPTRKSPLLVVFHGLSMTGADMSAITGFNDIADREGIIVAYPDALRATAPWNVGQNVCGNGQVVNGSNDDQALLDAVITDVAQDRCVDTDHIFVTGFSMGGYFSNEVGCQRSDVAAIAPHSGGTHDLSKCVGSIKPVIGLHFEQDALIDAACGADASRQWAVRNGCDVSVSPEQVQVSGGVCEYYRACPASGQVAHCTFQVPEGGGGALVTGHGWAGGAPDPLSIVGTARASDLIWDFFTHYAW